MPSLTQLCPTQLHQAIFLSALLTFPHSMLFLSQRHLAPFVYDCHMATPALHVHVVTLLLLLFFSQYPEELEPDPHLVNSPLEDVLDLVHGLLVDVLLKPLPHLLEEVCPLASTLPQHQGFLLLTVLIHPPPSSA